MVSLDMEYRLDCDSCEFARYTDDIMEADNIARQHEVEHGDHFVIFETSQTDE